jgi:non-ribosomal peptide synthetase component F
MIASVCGEGGVLGRQAGFWREVLAGLPEEIQLPWDRRRPAVPSFQGDAVELVVAPELHGLLRALAQRCGVTMFMIMHAAVAALLTRLGAGTDIPFGVPVAGRTDEALGDIVGLFVNTLVLRTDTSGDPTFRELVARVRKADLAAYAHQDIPFERVVEIVKPARTGSRNPLFQVMLVLYDEGALSLPGLTAIPEKAVARRGTAKFDLTFAFKEQVGTGGPSGMTAVIEYATDLFDGPTVEALSQRLLRVFAAAAADPDIRIGQLNLLTEG